MIENENIHPTPENPNITWERTKTVLKFWWRHFLTIPVVLILLYALIQSNKGLIISTVFWGFMAVVFDKVKFQLNSSKYEGPSRDNRPAYIRESYNPVHPGSVAYMANRINS